MSGNRAGQVSAATIANEDEAHEVRNEAKCFKRGAKMKVSERDVAGGKIIGQRPTPAQFALHALRLVNGERTGLRDLLKEAQEVGMPVADFCQIDNRLLELDRQREKLFPIAFPAVMGTVAANRHEIDKAVDVALEAAAHAAE